MFFSIIVSLFFFLVVIIVLVSVHELGHFVTAKWTGAFVERFSIGMGPVIFKKKVGETEYCLSAVPIGGYVKILGEDPEEADYNDPRNLQSKSSLQRLLVFVSGSLNNIVLAVILVTVSFMIGVRTPAYLQSEPVISWVAPGSTADEAGLMSGDKVKKVNTRRVTTWQELMENIGISPRGIIELEIERDKDVLNLDVKPEQIRQIGLGVIAVMHYIRPELYYVAEEYPAFKAGLEAGDIVKKINDTGIKHWNDISLIVRSNIALETMKIKVQRGDTIKVFELAPVLIDGSPGIGIGSRPEETVIRSYSLFPAVLQSLRQCREWIVLTGRFIGNLVTSRASIRSVGGPIMIADLSGAIGKEALKDRFGGSQFLIFLGFISLQLGIINLMPFPVLDGGHILFLFFEKIMGRERIKKAKSISQVIGIVFLISLSVLIVINDIIRIITP